MLLRGPRAFYNGIRIPLGVSVDVFGGMILPDLDRKVVVLCADLFGRRALFDWSGMFEWHRRVLKSVVEDDGP